MSAENLALAAFVTLVAASAAAVRAFFRRRARSTAPRTGRTLLGGNLLVLALLASVAMLAGELWFRFVHDATDSFDETRASARWFERHWRLNKDSFRDDVEYDLGPVPAGRRRVTFVGDSFTAAQGVADVGERFANRVRAARPEWDVHVLAMNGWDTGQELQFLDARIPEYTKGRYGFDEVVLVYCLNDVFDLVPAMKEIVARVRETRDRGVLAESSWLFDMLRFAWRSSRLGPTSGYFKEAQTAHEGAAWEEQQRRLTAVYDAVTARGGRLSVVTWPMLHQLGTGYPFRATHERLAAFWKERGVAHLDLLPEFDGRDAADLVANRFDAHPNADAHRIAAEAILPFLDAEMARPR
jgi:hypothetical protein